MTRGMFSKVLQRLGDRHVEHLGYVRALPLYLQRLPVVACAVANFAWNRDIRQELHLDINVAVAGAGFAPAALHVEREPAGLVAPSARFRYRREQFADGCERARVGSRVRARSAPDWRLVYVHHLVYVLDAGYRVAVAGTLAGSVEGLRELLVQDFVYQRALARA